MLLSEINGLSSDKLNYRIIDDRDRLDLKEILKDKEVCEPAGFKVIDDEMFPYFFKTFTEEGKAIGLFRDKQLVGYFRINDYVLDSGEYKEANNISVGFCVGKDYQRNGYGSEALIFITKFLKQEYDHVFADHFKENIACQRTILKAGYKYFDEYTMYFRGLGQEKTVESYVY